MASDPTGESVPVHHESEGNTRRPRASLLTRADCLRLHQASLRLLREIGVQVFAEEGLKILRKAGAKVDGDQARIPSSLVEWALASAPSAFNLYRRGSREIGLRLDGEGVYFGPGSDTLHYLDPADGARRDFQLSDLEACYRLCDGLPEIDFVMSIGIPRDVPVDRSYRHQFATMLRCTTKPLTFVCNDLADIEAIAAMAAAVAGGEDALRERPNLLLYSEPRTPLQHSLEATQKLLFCARNKIPVTHSPAPMMGGTAPVTLAGAVVLGNAEMLSGLVMHQLENPGAPFLYGHGVHHMDMKAMVSVYGAPEFQLARMMAADVARFYGLPAWGYAAHSDSKSVDGQAAADAQFSIQVALMARTNLNHDVGYLESGLAWAPEMIVLADEIIAMNRAFDRGVRIDEETLALDVIQEVGPGGEFMSHEHTMAHFRELWSPGVFDRQRYDRWEGRGGKSLAARCREKALALMQDHQVEGLPAAVETELMRYCK